MKIQTSKLLFQSQNQRQASTVRVGQRAFRNMPPTAPQALTQTASLRRSLDSMRQSHQTQQSVSTTADGQQQRYASASATQNGMRRFVEQQALGLASSGALPPASALQHDTHSYFLHTSSESTAYQLQGDIALEDGRNIQFNITGNMSRSLRIEEGSGVYSGKVVQKDPLILNLSAPSAQLTETSFRFDINNDGEKEDVSFATQGSAFLFVDHNQNGKLDDGSELFGTESGNGFAELAQHDDDSNGYIDSNDAIYRQLKLLSRDEQGNDTVSSLAGADIGALGLQSATTEFEITNDWQQSRGRLRATGVAVGNDSRVVTLQQVDLTQRNLSEERRFRERFEMPTTASAPARNMTEPGALAIEEALNRLREMTEKMQGAMAASQDDSDNTAPKSLLEMLVDRFFPDQQKGSEKQ